MWAVILFAHGSRDARWHEPVQAVAARMRAQAPHVPVRCAYLELSTPDLAAAAAELAAAGATAIRIVPLFLGLGRHVREDLPRLLDALRATHTGVRFDLLGAVGEDARVVDLLAQIALAPEPSSP